jgi:hypothetical protein
MSFGRNDMQRVNGLRIEEESRRKDEEVQNRLATQARFDGAPPPGRLSSFVSRIRRAARR